MASRRRSTTTRSTNLDQQLFPNPHSPPPPDPAERPRPTLGDIPLPPRRALRNGTSSRGSSRGSSVSGSRPGSRRSTISEEGREAGDMRLRLRELARGMGAAQRDDQTVGRRRLRLRVRDEGDEVDDVNELDVSDDDLDWRPDTTGNVDRSSTNSPIPLPRPPGQARGRPRLVQPAPRPATDDNAQPSLTDLVTQLIDDNNAQHEEVPPLFRRPREPQAFPVDRPPSSRESAASDSSDIVVMPDPNVDPDRRFTAQEKGKGRAVRAKPIEIVDDDEEEEDGDQSIQFIGTKRRRDVAQDDGIAILSSDEGGEVEEEDEGFKIEEDEGFGSWTCPICFCPPEMAVLTLCGHCLCGKCLFDAMIAAVKRHPPAPPPPPRGRRPPATPAPPQILRGAALGGPKDWTVDTLRPAYLASLHRSWESNLLSAGIEPGLIPLLRESGEYDLPKLDNVIARAEAKGVWSMQAGQGEKKEYVIEGECPVCRNTIPGGFGPLGSGIGGVFPISMRKYKHMKR